jgi:hypothetical protein
VSGASDILDPVGAAKDDIDRSKHLIASTLEDLTRHHSWLESYHRDERRRAERLRRQEALQRLELRRQRAAWLLRRFTLIAFAAARTTAISLVRFLRAARGFTLRAVAWTAPRARALAVIVARWLSAGLVWSERTAVSLARTGFAGASIGFAWSVRTSDALGIAFRRRLSAWFAWLWAEVAVLTQPIRKRASKAWLRTLLQSKRLASTMQSRFLANWSWLRSSAPHLARNFAGEIFATSTQFASDSWSWAGQHARRILKKSGPRHRALVVRRCTDLILAEPWRARLPAIR